MKNIVILGGGTGLSTLLRGIKKIEGINITAIVTIADSGSSTGVISREFDIPAVGDLRRVIASLSEEREELEEAMNYRFKKTGSFLDNHTVGNLIIASQILAKKDFAKGIKSACNMLNVKGTILPVSNTFNHIKAEYVDGSIIEGEEKIGHSEKVIKKVFYDEKAKASEEAVKAIEKADCIVFGIGSLYTSLIANLVYSNIQSALKRTKAKIVYFANIWTQHGETDNMTLKDHVKAIEDHTHKNIIDYVIVAKNDFSEKIIDAYKEDQQTLVVNDIKSYKEYDLAHAFKTDQVWHKETKIKIAFEDILKLI